MHRGHRTDRRNMENPPFFVSFGESCFFAFFLVGEAAKRALTAARFEGMFPFMFARRKILCKLPIDLKI